jgi:hypothetical protein
VILKVKMTTKSMRAWRRFTSSKPMKAIIRGGAKAGGQIELGAKRAGQGIRQGIKEVGGQVALGAKRAATFVAKHPEVLAAAPLMLRKGGFLRRNRLAIVHKGEMVLPAKTTKAIKKLVKRIH